MKKHIKSFENYSRVDEGYKNAILTSILALMSLFPKMSHAQDSLSGKDGYEYAQQMKRDYDSRIQDLIAKIEDLYPSQMEKYPFSQLKSISQKTRLQKFDMKSLDDIEAIVNEASKHDPEIGYILGDIIWSIRNNEPISDERISEIENSLNSGVNRIKNDPSPFARMIIIIGFFLPGLLLLRELWMTLSGRYGNVR